MSAPPARPSSQLFTPAYAYTARISDLMRRVHDFEFVTAANEVEALVLEHNLIKHYRRDP